jgi:hypothetical protein
MLERPGSHVSAGAAILGARWSAISMGRKTGCGEGDWNEVKVPVAHGQLGKN